MPDHRFSHWLIAVANAGTTTGIAYMFNNRSGTNPSNLLAEGKRANRLVFNSENQTFNGPGGKGPVYEFAPMGGKKKQRPLYAGCCFN